LNFQVIHVQQIADVFVKFWNTSIAIYELEKKFIRFSKNMTNLLMSKLSAELSKIFSSLTAVEITMACLFVGLNGI